MRFDQRVDEDDVWLCLPRLEEIAAPAPSNILAPWIDLPKDAARAPVLRPEIPDPEDANNAHKLADHPLVRESFDWYLEHLWAPWAATEVPRRKVRMVYRKLFELYQILVSEGSESPMELVWGLGFAAWKRPGVKAAVRYPLITQICEIALNPKTYDLEIRPRAQDPKLETDCYADMEVAGVPAVEASWKAMLATAPDRVNPFDDTTFLSLLQSAVGRLDPDGRFRTNMARVEPPAPSDHLQITDAWVLFARTRTPDILLRDIERLKEAVDKATELPPVVRALVTQGSDTVRVNPERPFRGLSTSEPAPGAHELYFPMPYNDEQVSIVGKLQYNDGVVVQGPPGTGKTHTIANVICHYLAQGKRVLVTSKGESALAVLQDKLPERVRPLSVALLASDREGTKQFERSIQQIASTVSGFDARRAERAIADCETTLDRIHGKIATVDRAVADAAQLHLKTYKYQDQEVTALDLAELVVAQADEHAWFDDALAPTVEDSLPFDPALVAQLKGRRRIVGGDLHYLGQALPALGELPNATELIGLHHDLLKAGEIESNIYNGALLSLIDRTAETFERARELLSFLSELQLLRQTVARAGIPWIDTLIRRVGTAMQDAVLESFFKRCAEAEALEAQRHSLVAQAVVIPPGAETHEDYLLALQRLQAGQKPFLLPFGNGEARAMLTATLVGGASPGREGWDLVAEGVRWRSEARALAARWCVIASELAIQRPPEDPDAASKQMSAWAACMKDARRLATEFEAPLHARAEAVFGTAAAKALVAGDADQFERALVSLRSHIERHKLAYASEKIAVARTQLERCTGDLVEALSSVLARVGVPETDEADLHAQWSLLSADLERVNTLKPALEDIGIACSTLEAAGARNWASRLRRVPAADDDPLIPSTWLAAWRWREAHALLEQIDGHQKLRQLFAERKRWTSQLESTYQDLVAEKAWLEVFNKSPDSVLQALQKYLRAVKSLGHGTGIRSKRHRRDARDAMLDAYKSVPCWVLPHWRVSEALPAELGLFDLIVVDEASQSDISALPALLRGQTVLVVGDDKQVSPSLVGISEKLINDLRDRYLADQPHGAQMTPDKSIYDLATVIFAGNAVMLKEHFRCVPAIIEFSNRTFYGGAIRPLRLPRANERLDPPLIDVFVKGGVRRGEANEAEAQAVVQEVQAILDDPAMAGRSIGVVTLVGQMQAKRIHTLLHKLIPPPDIVARKIAVGPPPIFQGRERDIMLVSMVLGHGDLAVNTEAQMEQRFNVAMSRARDRMILFRSLQDSELRDDSLNSKVLQHFRQPFKQDPRNLANLRSLCESDFERAMFDELTQRGYRVTPQVGARGFRIDFVVEGSEGRRLAVECDGDKYHGPGQWREDMQRQRVLERAGWTFWRCFGSSFTRRRQEVIDDLLATLANQGIEPIGAESVDPSLWVTSREVDPLGVDKPEDIEDDDEDEDEDEEESMEADNVEVA